MSPAAEWPSALKDRRREACIASDAAMSPSFGDAPHSRADAPGGTDVRSIGTLSGIAVAPVGGPGTKLT